MHTSSMFRNFARQLSPCGEFKSTVNGNAYFEIKGVVRVMCRKRKNTSTGQPDSNKGIWEFVLYQANPKSANHGKIIHQNMHFNRALAYVKAMVHNSNP